MFDKVIIYRDGNSIELTDAEIEMAFRVQQRRYNKMDVLNAIELQGEWLMQQGINWHKLTADDWNFLVDYFDDLYNGEDFSYTEAQNEVVRKLVEYKRAHS